MRSRYDECRDEIVAIACQLVENWTMRSDTGILSTYVTDDEYDELTAAVIALRYAQAQALNTNSLGPSVTGAPSTSRDAAVAILPRSGSIRRRVVVAFANRGDGLMTDEMLERELRMKHQTVSSARNWCVEHGLVENSGQKAPTSSGAKAVLWQLTRAARGLIAQGLT